MFGYVRFFLASLVALSHIGITFFGQNPGVIAVVVFYMLAGFVVTHLMTKIFPSGERMLTLFYLERFLRIYPLYLFVLLLTVVFILITGFGNPTYSLGRLTSNLLIIPLNYYMVIDSTILDIPNGWLIPPAWSLGAELQAYFILPFIIAYKRVKIVFALLTLSVFIMANLSFIHTDFFGYRLIPGIFFIFILGSCIYKVVNTPKEADFFDRFFPVIIYAFCIVAFVIFGLTNRLEKDFIPEVLLGIILAVPIIYFGSSKKIKLSYNGFLGSLSYGVFLSHYLGIWFFHLLFPNKDVTQVAGVSFVLIIAIMIAMAGNYMVEKPIMVFRRKLSSSTHSNNKNI